MTEFYHQRWPVFYEDNHLLVLYKPAGLVMQRDHKGKANLLDLAKAWIKAKYQKPGRAFAGMVHRLDAPVAGVTVVARTSKSASRLSAQFRETKVQKTYLAVVQGTPPEDEARLVHYLLRLGRRSRVVARPEDHAKEASLSYRLLNSRRHTSLIEVTLETGRRHQIRAQLAAIGSPILGDKNYGAARAMDHGRIALLAHKLSFEHPTQKTRLEFICPRPKGWPWPGQADETKPPYWTIEEYLLSGLKLPDLSVE